MFTSKHFDARGDAGSPRHVRVDHSFGWGTRLAVFEVVAGIVYLFSPAIAAGKVAVLTGMSMDRAVEFVVGMLGVVLATLVRNRAPTGDVHSET